MVEMVEMAGMAEMAGMVEMAGIAGMTEAGSASGTEGLASFQSRELCYGMHIFQSAA